MDNIDQALDYFNQGEGFSCWQAVLATFAPQLGLERETALKIAAAFGGGMASMGATCGAVTGALMVIGLQSGATVAGDEQAKERTYGLVNQFVDRFQTRHGSITCKELLGHDVSIPEERERARDQGLFATQSPRFVQDAAEIIEEILAVAGVKGGESNAD